MTSPSATALLTALMLAVPAQAADRKKPEKSSDFDPKGFLIKVVSGADKDGDGALSIQEFEKLPLLREAKREKIDELFVSVDADSNGALSTEEVTKGLGKITDLLKAGKPGAGNDDARRGVKKLKRSLSK